jgi:L-lactate dehydrogenase
MSKQDTFRVAIIGAGNVGATTAYALLWSGLAAEIVLIDLDRVRAEGEVMDLRHAVPLTHATKIRTGELADCAGAAVTVIAAGAGQRPGETRLDLVKRNVVVLRSILAEVTKANPSGIILITTNPVDILTYEAVKLSGLPQNRVFGSGTILDTARFRYLLSGHFGVDARSVHALIIGEHGDSEVPVWSSANIAGMGLRPYCAANGKEYSEAALDDIFQQTRNAAYEIIKRKKATFYAVAAGIVRIIEAIVRDQRTVLCVSSLISDYYGMGDVCFSLPTIIGRNGVEGMLRLDLDESEIAALRRSYDVLRKTLDEVKEDV